MNYTDKLIGCLVDGIEKTLKNSPTLAVETKKIIPEFDNLKEYIDPHTGRPYHKIDQPVSLSSACRFKQNKLPKLQAMCTPTSQTDRKIRRDIRYKDYRWDLNKENVSDKMLLDLTEAHLKRTPKILFVSQEGTVSCFSANVRGDPYYSKRIKTTCTELYDAVSDTNKLCVHMVLTLKNAREKGLQSFCWNNQREMIKSFCLELNASNYDIWMYTVESTERGFPHWHFLIQTHIPKDKKYYDSKNKCWRVADRYTFFTLKSCWKYGISDIRAITSKPDEYLSKYITKGFSPCDVKRMRKQSELKSEQRKSLLTILCCLAYSTRMFGASKKARKARKALKEKQAQENAERDAHHMLLELSQKQSLNALIILLNNVLRDCTESYYLITQKHKLHPKLPDGYSENLPLCAKQIEFLLGSQKMNCSNCDLVKRVEKLYKKVMKGEELQC